LRPAARAAPLRLLRRARLDLTGLPPTADECREFEKRVASDGGEAALAQTVDQLLADSAFGEHLSVAWLDAARYADSYGYQSDQLNTQWPYRDWVVRALNDNMPYDEFLTCQLAGDLLENPSRDQVLATAFNRLHRLTNEGGSIAEEALVENAADRVHTLGTAILGLTLECARCHDHKYDPITMRDYYSLMSFFNSIDENGLYDHAEKVPSPTLLLPTPDQESALAAASKRVVQAQAALASEVEAGKKRLEEWLANTPFSREADPTPGVSGRRVPAAEPSAATALAAASRSAAPRRLGFASRLNGDRGDVGTVDLIGYFTFDGELAQLANESENGEGEGAAAGLTSVPGIRGQAVRFDGDRGAIFPDMLKVDRWERFTLDFWMRDNKREALPVVVLQRTFGTDTGYNGFDVMLQDGVLEARFYRVWPGNAIGVRSVQPIARSEWAHVAVTYDGSSTAAGLKLYLNGGELATAVVRDRVQKRASLPTHGEGHLIIGQRFRDRGFKDGDFDELRIFTRALTPLEIRHLHDGTALTEALAAPDLHRAALEEYYVSAIDEPARRWARELATARRRLVELEDQVHEVPVMAELAEPRPTHILARGAYDAPKTNENRVTRDTFAQILLPFPKDAPRNRLGLARWLTDPRHPLTARVFVNRLWANFFGRGLVTTPENFGQQGAAPTNPELLDWLARDFVDHNWSIKRLCRSIVLSATYAQDSRCEPAQRELDPENDLLARGPRHRLSAEQIRDLALAGSGLLDRRMGGPPVSPYQPGEDLWREANQMSPPYRQSAGKDLHRRSLYSVWKRTVPLPNMLTFDAPTREVCAVSRGRTNTPLQALVLLNDVQFVEAARALAADVANAYANVNDQLGEAFLRLTGRPPDSTELELLLGIYEDQRKLFETSSEPPGLPQRSQDAAKFLGLGDAKPPATIDPAHLAALTVACQAILNLDATIYKR
jgi:hypothetical protein